MENNQAPVTPHPKKKKHGPIYYAFTVLGWILCAIVVWALIYETFFEEKREVPSEGIVTSTQSEEDPLLVFLDNPIRFEDSYTGSYIGGLNFELYLIGEDEVTAIRYVRDTVIYLICEVDRSTAASLNGSQRYNITGCVDGINSTLGYVYLSDCTFEPVS